MNIKTTAVLAAVSFAAMVPPAVGAPTTKGTSATPSPSPAPNCKPSDERGGVNTKEAQRVRTCRFGSRV